MFVFILDYRKERGRGCGQKHGKRTEKGWGAVLAILGFKAWDREETRGWVDLTSGVAYIMQRKQNKVNSLNRGEKFVYAKTCIKPSKGACVLNPCARMIDFLPFVAWITQAAE